MSVGILTPPEDANLIALAEQIMRTLQDASGNTLSLDAGQQQKLLMTILTDMKMLGTGEIPTAYLNNPTLFAELAKGLVRIPEELKPPEKLIAQQCAVLGYNAVCRQLEFAYNYDPTAGSQTLDQAHARTLSNTFAGMRQKRINLCDTGASLASQVKQFIKPQATPAVTALPQA
ncbi:hypothetical protein A2334_00605 [Candidatus Roizmanbacteria bacterium RIFOXYB2_FULL_38_10]|uniref:Uncharacterized protein n=1 Tax=Candidatus Roizmanbacteria bacterium RIFOXYD1_FULL_38_12 TaxID=1802093 RepID=A0A1F7L1B9_9BACT|nr:MAG: hypothetical protein A3K47_03875 [Candidatus Roizmanbacteria bacterium RIFOXYA2_FULL_38_14]OGK63896.1 MAG: hypothetical protein A3K27_03875 [Candidatus Roizmanbacteria bacterium RIFOXYA1_FULL_37_12]OGK65742.1 MAG: hypothetical protein A3K38_03875 [Candidatus Roizmanbacteria bacterium RIFOXYB1_FULL_40_23]OGK68187.1 MAG: hypothetical protein A2334_00605 [Candidatus Roizmanbacteria bacterium RIFOXYB2_FULL_38_10]OGK70147.1 MAG: hypothetical protein A3K21_03880 [Candidatus Roizmanbacteria ba